MSRELCFLLHHQSFTHTHYTLSVLMLNQICCERYQHRIVSPEEIFSTKIFDVFVYVEAHVFVFAIVYVFKYK